MERVVGGDRQPGRRTPKVKRTARTGPPERPAPSDEAAAPDRSAPESIRVLVVAGVRLYREGMAFNLGNGDGFTNREELRLGTDPTDPTDFKLGGALTSIDPEMQLFDTFAMSDRIERSLNPRRAPMLLSLGFGVVALLLATIGIYGVLAYQVGQRTREIGIRMALGSDTHGIVRLILREGLVLVLGGLALGVAGVAALRGFITSQLYGVGPLDAAVMLLVTAVLAIASVVACVGHARRAARVDPVVDRNQAAVPEPDPGFGQIFGQQWDVQVVWWEEAAERATDLQCPESVAGLEATAELLYEVAQGDAELDLVHAGVCEPLTQAHEFGAGLDPAAQSCVGGASVAQYPRHRGQRFHVVDRGGLPVEPVFGGIGRPGAHVAAESLQRVQEGGFLPGDVGACALHDLHVEVDR